MITAGDDYYEQLRVAHMLVNRYEDCRLGKVSLTVYEIEGAKLAMALLDVEERRQLALGELGEAVMKEGDALDTSIGRAVNILAGRVAV